MKHRRMRSTATVISASLLCAAAMTPSAGAGVKNGGFERGSLAGWAKQSSSLNPGSVAEWRVYTKG